jgi:hypothetical protein
MPNRILRDGILSSESVCSLHWAAEVFYRRLMSVVDDHGRYHGLPTLVRSGCYPLQIDKVSDKDVVDWIAECVRAKLVGVYVGTDGKQYLQILKFGQQVRAKSKFPEPDEGRCVQPLAPASNCAQAPADAHLVVFGDGVVVEGEKDPPNPPRGASRPVSFKTWITKVREAGEKPIPDDDPVFAYADQAGIPRDFLALAWGEFKARHTEPGAKQYRDFRKAFRNCIRGNWYRLWTCDSTGYRLTGNGAQAERVAEGATA